jgi:ribosomal protein L11 methyltransferase
MRVTGHASRVTTMPFLQLTVDIGKADPEPFEDALFAAGATSVTLEDSADDPILEPAPGATPLWPTVTVKALFVEDADADEITAMLKNFIGDVPPHRFQRIADRPWEREWMKDFRPMQFGKRLWVVPGNMEIPSEFRSSPLHPFTPSPVPVHLDPGLAFGTGTHPTTALCLEWLDGADLHGKRIIDYGCGSGILAIAALKLGAEHAVGVDIDEQALIASKNNATQNGVSNQLGLQPISEPLPQVDILLANILAGPLNELAPTLSNLVKPGGSLVLSGILKDQAPGLAQRYSAWFDMDEPAAREDWVRLTGKKRP